MTGGVGDELLFAGIAIENRLARNPSCISDQILDQDILLAAVSATDTLLDDADLVLGNLAYPCNDTPHVIGNLGGSMKHQPSTVDLGITDMRLEGCTLDLACLIGPFNNHIRFLESLLDITDLAMGGTGDVAPDITMQGELVNYLSIPWIGFLVVLVQILGSSCAIFDNAVVNQGSTLFHRLLNGQHGFEDFILHLDCIAGGSGLLFGLGHDGRHPVPDVADLAVEKPAVVRTWFRISLTRLHVEDIRTIFMGDDRNYTIHLQSFTGVDLSDVCMSIGAAQQYHCMISGKHPVLDKTRLAGYQLRTVHLRFGFADIGQILSEGWGDFTLVGTGLHPLDSQLDRQVVVLIPGIANENSAENLIDLCLGRIIHPLKQPGE